MNIYEFIVNNKKSDDKEVVEIYFQVSQNDEIKTYVLVNDNLREVTSTANDGWGMSFHYRGGIHYRKLPENEANIIQKKIHNLDSITKIVENLEN